MAELLFDVPESVYHSDTADLFGPTPNLTVSTAKALVLESPAHAYMRHPRLGGQPMVPSSDMDRGTLLHAFLLGRGGKIAVIPCDDWKSPKNRELRDEQRALGFTAVTEKLYDETKVVAKILKPKLAARGYALNGRSEVTFRWTETADDGTEVACRGRADHLDGADLFDLKITGSANPRTLTRGHIVRMGYDIQEAGYERGVSAALPNLLGRLKFTLLFCEPEPPYCVTPVRMAGSLRELGALKWQRGVNTWANCLANKHWPEYTDSVVFAEARPWDFEEEESAA